MRLQTRRRLTTLMTAVMLATNLMPALAQPVVQPGALPTGWATVAGQAAIVQNGTTLNINQTTPQALVNFATFNVGAGALVDIRQLNASSALLARTTGGDPSQIQGQIKANGALWLINPAGIMVGAGARIDVGRFIGSTLNVSDSDFLAGRLNFNAAGLPAPSAGVSNAGTINTASGGSIYLVGPGVSNTGLLNAPNGEVLLAAGQTVRLVDTGTPGVSVAITGAPGEVRNLGQITAEAGRIGLAAGLVGNSGSINAASVVREGGRIFLRASGDLKTTAASAIDASGTTGGSVVLYAGNAASIDGMVKATGSAGKGGFVDTSGKRSLDVAKAPVVGKGGEWLIDPFDMEIYEGSPEPGEAVIVSSGGFTRVAAATIAAQLNAGTNVSVTTGGSGDPEAGAQLGDITVTGHIRHTGEPGAELSLNASNDIRISGGITGNGLMLNLNSNVEAASTGGHAVSTSGSINLGGGALNVSEGLGGVNNGTLDIVGGTTWLIYADSAINAASVNVRGEGLLHIGREGSAISGALNNDGHVSVATAGTVLLDHGGTHSGVFDINAPGVLSLSGGHTFNSGTQFTSGGTVALGGEVTLASAMDFSPGSASLVLHEVDLHTAPGNGLTTSGAGVVVDGAVRVHGEGGWQNRSGIDVLNAGSIHASDENTFFENTGSITTSGSVLDVLQGSAGEASTFINKGTIIKTGTASQEYVAIDNQAGSVVDLRSGRLAMNNSRQAGEAKVALGSTLILGYTTTMNSGASFTGAGDVRLENDVMLNTALDFAAGGPALAFGPSVKIAALNQDAAASLTTRNTVTVDGTELTLGNGVKWINHGATTVGLVNPAHVVFEGSASFDNKQGATLNVDMESTLKMAAGSVITNESGATINLAAAGPAQIFDAGNVGRVVNSGTMVKTGDGSLFVPLSNLAAGTVLINEGQLSAKLSQANPNAGTIALREGSTLGNDGDIYNTGTIRGSGTIAMGGAAGGTLFNNGTMTPGDGEAIGRFAIQGNYSQGSAGVLNIRMDGTGAGEFDSLDVDGSAALGGTLNLATRAAFAPADAATADIIVARGGNNSGTFSQVNAPTATGENQVTTLSVGYAAGGDSAVRVTAAVTPGFNACVANPAIPGCTAVLPPFDTCVAAPTTPGCEAVLPTLESCIATPGAAGCSVVLPSLAACTAEPGMAGCSVVLPTLQSCIATPGAAGCSAVLPSLAACTSAPATPGCSVVLPTLQSCIATPGAAGCSVVLPSLAACTAEPAMAGCSVVLPTLQSCIATPGAAGCSVVLPSLAACTAAPATPGCSVVLPTLSACIVSPAAAGCSAVLPSLATCTATPALAGCAVVLPSLAACTAAPTLSGCSAVLPSLAFCTGAPATPGCIAVLPTLSSCMATPTRTGCSAVLPTLAACTAVPTLAGCSVVLPPVSACAANPSAPGCVVVSPLSQASIVQAAGASVVLINSATGAVPSAGSPKEPEPDGPVSIPAAQSGTAKTEPVKKTYCN